MKKAILPILAVTLTAVTVCAQKSSQPPSSASALPSSASALTPPASPQQRHLFEDAWRSVRDDGEAFRAGGDWFPYPAYRDRAAWDELCAPFSDQIKTAADKYLDYKWQTFKASAYLEYEKTGDRSLALCQEENRVAIIALTLGELMDGTGKYLPQLIDGLCFMADQYSWGHFQHTGYQKTHRTLPDGKEYVISLHSANSAAAIAIAWHFFHGEFDRIDPSISPKIRDAMRLHLLEPFMNEAQDSGAHRIWTGFRRAPGKKLNNWAPYCDQHSTLCWLLMETDRQKLVGAMDRSVKIMDMYMNDQRQDGCCDEGPGYWDMSFGKVYDYAVMLRDATGGKADVLKDPLIRRMGEYKSKTYLGDGWVVDFGDSHPRASGNGGALFRFGRDAGSRELMDFGVYLLADSKGRCFKLPALSISQLPGTYRQLEMMRYYKDIRAYEDSLLSSASFEDAVKGLREGVGSVYYPETDYAVFRVGKMAYACKGAHNGESHNHNDVGSGILVWDNMPVIMDPGMGKYVKETFSSKRYTLWMNRSDSHATPAPNGVLQHEGREYAAKSSVCSLEDGTYVTDIAGAYPEEAGCESWLRTVKVSPSSLQITDKYRLKSRKGADIEFFPILGDIALPRETVGDRKAGRNEIIVRVWTRKGGKCGYVRVKWSSNLSPSVTPFDLKDQKSMRKALGKRPFSQLRFTSPAGAPLSGTYKITFTAI